jgi:hypothetical protein
MIICQLTNLVPEMTVFVNRESWCTVCTVPMQVLELKIFYGKGDITALYR